MKIVKALPIILISLLLLKCSSFDNFSEIKVGMTYDEVDNILGKPKEISRGVNELIDKVEELPYEILKRLNIEIDSKETNRWYSPMKIQIVGNLIYVNWVYEKEKDDTFYVVLDIYENVVDTSYKKNPVYYINNKKVSKAEYLKTRDREKTIHAKYPMNTIIDTSKLSQPTKIEKRIEYITESSIKNYEVKGDSTEKNFYVVKFKYCVLFDASSGRVTESGYFPFYVKPIN
jgi:outer membrane protein assembly factor BamE (lipoprotein component of BamABCDE complex)